jgi:hypothetical protein
MFDYDVDVNITGAFDICRDARDPAGGGYRDHAHLEALATNATRAGGVPSASAASRCRAGDPAS